MNIGNGATNTPFPFTYEDKLEVHVERGMPKLRFVELNVTVEFQNPTTIKFAPVNYTFRIMRETDLDEMEVTFYPGSSICAQDLNTNFEQLRDAIQEGWCRFLRSSMLFR